MWTTFILAAAFLAMPVIGFAQDASTDISVDADVEVEVKVKAKEKAEAPKNLGQTIKANCAGLSGVERVICLREVLKKKAKGERVHSPRGRGRAVEVHEKFQSRKKAIKEIGSGMRKPKARAQIEKVGGKVKYMTKDERKILKGEMRIGAEVSAEAEQREKLRQAKVDSLKKRIHKR